MIPARVDVFEQPVCYLLSILNGRFPEPQELPDLGSMSVHDASIPLDVDEALRKDI